jgi:NADH-quinone oxidoreductase subunit J
MLLQRNVIVAGLFMVLAFLGVSGLFLLLANPVSAAFQVIVYSGAIMVLVLFVIMLLNSHEEEPAVAPRPIQRWLSVAVALVMGVGAVKLVLASKVAAALDKVGPGGGTVTLDHLGDSLFRDHLLSFEVIGLMLLAAMVGAVALTKREL